MQSCGRWRVDPVMNNCYAVVLICALTCSSCQLFDPTVREYETLFKTQKMIIGPYTPEHAARNGPGFGVTMQPDEARKVNAPNSAEFRKMLEEQLSIERSHGKNYCPYGYEVDRTIYSKHWYTEIWVNCKHQAQQ